ncbi:hypothetical protein DFH11DRAFT_1734469 [Phellopilus nigrolimitatus]|nr:hypothetical protein DFH11DRAFT_1734469 [Phellopilus nigrolimitatus]
MDDASLLALFEDAMRVEALLRDPGGSLRVVKVMFFLAWDDAHIDEVEATAALLGLLIAPYPAPAGAPPHAKRHCRGELR